MQLIQLTKLMIPSHHQIQMPLFKCHRFLQKSLYRQSFLLYTFALIWGGGLGARMQDLSSLTRDHTSAPRSVSASGPPLDHQGRTYINLINEKN